MTHSLRCLTRMGGDERGIHASPNICEKVNWTDWPQIWTRHADSTFRLGTCYTTRTSRIFYTCIQKRHSRKRQDCCYRIFQSLLSIWCVLISYEFYISYKNLLCYDKNKKVIQIIVSLIFTLTQLKQFPTYRTMAF